MLLICYRRFRYPVAIALPFLVIAAIACGTDAVEAPASGRTRLTERQALKRAIDSSQNGIYTSMLGTPVAVWGSIMSYGEAAELMGQSISIDTSEYERRNDRVWYIVLEGELSVTTPRVPGGGSTDEQGRGFMAIRFGIDGSGGGSSSSLTKSDFGQAELPVIEIPGDLESIVVPAAPPAPVVTAAPPATPAPLEPLMTPAGPPPILRPPARTATAAAEALLPSPTPGPTATPLPSPIEDTTNLLFDERLDHVLIGTVAEFLGEAEIPLIGGESSFINEWWRIETEEYLMGFFPEADYTVQVERSQVLADGSRLPLRFPFTIPEKEQALVFLTTALPLNRPPLSSYVFAIPRTGSPGGPNAAIFPVRDGRITVWQGGEPTEVELAGFIERFHEVATIAGRFTGPYPPVVAPTPTPTPAPTPAGGAYTVETLGPAIERLPDELKLVISDDVVVVFNDGDRARNLFFNFNGPATAFHLPTASYSDLRPEEPPSLYFRGTRRYLTPEAAEAINQAIYGSDAVIEAVRAFVASE